MRNLKYSEQNSLAIEGKLKSDEPNSGNNVYFVEDNISPKSQKLQNLKKMKLQIQKYDNISILPYTEHRDILFLPSHYFLQFEI